MYFLKLKQQLIESAVSNRIFIVTFYRNAFNLEGNIDNIELYLTRDSGFFANKQTKTVPQFVVSDGSKYQNQNSHHITRLCYCCSRQTTQTVLSMYFNRSGLIPHAVLI